MSTELVLRHSVAELEIISEKVAKSGLFGMEPEQAFTLCLLAEAEGLPAITALRRWHIIDGRPAMRADAMQAEFQRRGGRVQWVTSTTEDCEAVFTHPDFAPNGFKVRTTFKELERAGITSGKFGIKKNWKSFPRQMLRARVISEGVRAVDPGIVVGIYTPEEVSDFDARDVPIQAVATVATPATVQVEAQVLPQPPAPSAAVAEITEFFDRAAAPSEGKRWKDKVKELEAEGKPTTIPQTDEKAADGSHLARGEKRTWAGDLFALCRATNQEWESMCKAHGEKFRSIASQGVLERFLIDWAIGNAKIAPDYLLTQGREDRSKQTAFLERWHAKYRDEFLELAKQSLADLLNEAMECNGMNASLDESPAEAVEA